MSRSLWTLPTSKAEPISDGSKCWSAYRMMARGPWPLLRHIILNDDKYATYKLALLRVLCRIADGAAGYARDADDQHVAVPLGLVGLYWIRHFSASTIWRSSSQHAAHRHGEAAEHLQGGADWADKMRAVTAHARMAEDGELRELTDGIHDEPVGPSRRSAPGPRRYRRGGRRRSGRPSPARSSRCA